MVVHCPRIVLKASDEFQPLAHLPTGEIGSLYFCSSLVHTISGAAMLHCKDRKQNGDDQAQTSIK